MSHIMTSLEIPTALLGRLSPLVDMDFALAHRVLEDSAYARFYANRPNGRECLLDNSMHELGHPLAVQLLHRAADLVHADYVIAPDLLGEPERNLQWFRETYREMGSEFRIAVCASGRTAEERKLFLDQTEDSSMLCMPYRTPRLSWFLENPARGSRVHLLGVSTLSEARAWLPVATQFSTMKFSIDTSKPIKAALVGRRINDGLGLRGIPVSSKDLLGLHSFTVGQLQLMDSNIIFLRRWIQGLE